MGLQEEFEGINTHSLLSEFICPFEDDLVTAFIGDEFDEHERVEFETHLTDIRDDFTKTLVNMGQKISLKKIQFNRITLSQLFKGKAEPLFERPCVAILDSHLTKDVVNLLTQNFSYVDDLDRMLIDKYLIEAKQEKYIMDLSLLSDDLKKEFIYLIDAVPDKFNYIISRDYLALWINGIND
jgi:hypothetical protein